MRPIDLGEMPHVRPMPPTLLERFWSETSFFAVVAVALGLVTVGLLVLV